jgi:hypothetical protein
MGSDSIEPRKIAQVGKFPAFLNKPLPAKPRFLDSPDTQPINCQQAAAVEAVIGELRLRDLAMEGAWRMSESAAANVAAVAVLAGGGRRSAHPHATNSRQCAAMLCLPWTHIQSGPAEKNNVGLPNKANLGLKV